MSIKLIVTPEFTKSVKKLFNKYRLIYTDLEILQNELIQNAKAGVHIGKNCYKLRLTNSSVTGGKRGGFRVIYYYLSDDNKIFLLSIYSKTEISTISDNKLLQILTDNKLQ